jgi:hypothetical protein
LAWRVRDLTSSPTAVSRVAVAAAIPQRDVDDHTSDGYRRGEGGYRHQQPVVGQYRDVG